MRKGAIPKERLAARGSRLAARDERLKKKTVASESVVPKERLAARPLLFRLFT